MNIYAFPLSPADILTVEDWCDRIERMADCARTELSEMAKAAQREFAPAPAPMRRRTAEDVLRDALLNAANIYEQPIGLPRPAHLRALPKLGLTQSKCGLKPLAGC